MNKNNYKLQSAADLKKEKKNIICAFISRIELPS